MWRFIVGKGIIETGPSRIGREELSNLDKGLARARVELYLKSWISWPISSERFPTMNVGGRELHFWQFPVGFNDLQFGQMFRDSIIRLFLQRLHKTSPIWPQPLQEWGIIRSRRFGNVVFFTIKPILLLIL